MPDLIQVTVAQFAVGVKLLVKSENLKREIKHYNIKTFSKESSLKIKKEQTFLFGTMLE